MKGKLILAGLVLALSGCATSTPAQTEENNSMCLRVGPESENTVVLSTTTDTGALIAIGLQRSQVLAVGKWFLMGPEGAKDKVVVEWTHTDGASSTHIYPLADAYPCHF